MAAPAQLSVAPNDRRRERVLSTSALLGIVAVALVGLVLVFPRGDLLTLLRSDSDRSNQALTVSYLRNLIRTEPRDLNLRMLLIEKLIAASDLAAARHDGVELGGHQRSPPSACAPARPASVDCAAWYSASRARRSTPTCTSSGIGLPNVWK